jgi:hypothetical protein
MKYWDSEAFNAVRHGYETKEQEQARIKAKADKKANQPNLAIRVGKASQRIGDTGDSMMKRITIPIILFIIGAVTFPIGIIFWLVGLGLMFGSGKKR